MGPYWPALAVMTVGLCWPALAVVGPVAKEEIKHRESWLNTHTDGRTRVRVKKNMEKKHTYGPNDAKHRLGPFPPSTTNVGASTACW